MIEDDKVRRGEPVFYIDPTGEHCPATIEFGGTASKEVSLYLEFGGRVQTTIRNVEPDPGGKRPVWHRVK